MATILLIDDDPDVQAVMRILLQKEGYGVETASSRQEALEKLEQNHPSAIILDVLLSGSDGRELCRELKVNKLTSDIPVIIFSAHPSAALQFESYGADDFLSKPFQTEALLAKLSRHIKAIK